MDSGPKRESKMWIIKPFSAGGEWRLRWWGSRQYACSGASEKLKISKVEILRNNTDFATKKKGMFGVPSYVVNNDYHQFIWGQQKLHFVKDL